MIPYKYPTFSGRGNDRRRLNAYSDNSSETTVHLTDGMTRSWRDVKQRRLDEGNFAAV